MQEIAQITVFMAVTDDGEENVLVCYSQDERGALSNQLPLVAPSPDHARRMYPIARKLCCEHGKTLRVVQYTDRTDITRVFEGNGTNDAAL